MYLQQMLFPCFFFVYHILELFLGDNSTSFIFYLMCPVLGLPFDRILSIIFSIIKLYNLLPCLSMCSIICQLLFFSVSINVHFSSIVFKTTSFVLLSVQVILCIFFQHHICRASNIFLFFICACVSHPQSHTPYIRFY